MSEEVFRGFPRSTIPKQIRAARARMAAAEKSAADAKPARDAGLRVAGITAEAAEAEWRGWFARNGWRPFAYQEDAWRAYAAGRSGLILLPTGSGKTYAALGGPLMALRASGTDGAPAVRRDGLRILYVSPLKALVRDVEKAIARPLRELGWNLRVETRTGDTSATAKRRQRERLPHVLLTTPESLALMITQTDWRERFGGLEAIVIDEWHELIGSKRGSLLELTLARLRNAVPNLRTWAVSATLADPELAGRVATGGDDFARIEDRRRREVAVRTLLPAEERDLPWFGHSGLRRVPEVAAELDPKVTTLIFTNTRGQAERWFAALQAFLPEWSALIGLHHGSLDREERDRVENGVKEGKLPFVVATSSLDLGVDFPTVGKVIQIGSAKGVARATQRAGRAFHRPGEPTALTVCPTHFLEYVEAAALREAIADGELESRVPRERPLDVLVQFTLSCGLGEGFRPEELLREIRTAYSFRGVTDEEFAWTLGFVTTGGHTLRAYPQYRKLVADENGVYGFATPKLARLHRMNIGTIVGESGVRVSFLRGGALGQADESFVTKLRPGDVFTFAGRKLELIRVKDLVAYVRLATGKETVPTVWGGNALPISQSFSGRMRRLLARVADAPSVADEAALPPEMRALGRTFAIQRERSAIPRDGETLVERIETREGHHLFVYTWEGRAVNEGMGHLLAYRLGQLRPNTIAVSANDHGFECLGTEPFPDDEALRSVLTPGPDLDAEIGFSLNYPEMAKRAFREIARVSGLIQTGPPEQRKSMRHLQMSSSLLFDVFREHDPGHPLLREAFREVKRSQLELPRLKALLEEIARGRVRVEHPHGITPFAFPLYIERIRSRVSTETLADRIARLQRKVFAT